MFLHLLTVAEQGARIRDEWAAAGKQLRSEKEAKLAELKAQLEEAKTKFDAARREPRKTCVLEFERAAQRNVTRRSALNASCAKLRKLNRRQRRPSRRCRRPRSPQRKRRSPPPSSRRTLRRSMQQLLKPSRRKLSRTLPSTRTSRKTRRKRSKRFARSMCAVVNQLVSCSEFPVPSGVRGAEAADGRAARRGGADAGGAACRGSCA